MNQKQFSAKILYLILWGGTAVIVATMLAIGQWQQGKERRLQDLFFANKYSSGEVINNLMLSADELTIEEKKAFINIFLKQDNNNEVLAKRNVEKRDDIYKRIRERKIKKLSAEPPADFTIKPVPK